MEYLTRKKVLELIKQAVMFAPVDMGSARPNSFAIINGVADFNQTNLGYKSDDILNGDVWTREQATLNYIELKYPIVCPVLYGGTRKTEYSTKHQSYTFDEIRILAADRYHNNKEDVTTAESRSVTQIMDDTEKALNKILEYLFNVAAYKVEVTTGVFVEDYFNKDFLDWADTNNKIVGYTDAANSHQYNNVYRVFIEGNTNLRFDRLEYPTSTDMIVGTWLTLTSVSYQCADGEFDFFVDTTAVNDSRPIFFGK